MSSPVDRNRLPVAVEVDVAADVAADAAVDRHVDDLLLGVEVELVARQLEAATAADRALERREVRRRCRSPARRPRWSPAWPGRPPACSAAASSTRRPSGWSRSSGRPRRSAGPPRRAGRRRASAASVFSPVRGSWIRTSPARVVCSTRRSGSTARFIGSPGKSSRVTFWKLVAGGGGSCAPRLRGRREQGDEQRGRKGLLSHMYLPLGSGGHAAPDA